MLDAGQAGPDSMHAGPLATTVAQHFSAAHNAFYSSVQELFTPPCRSQGLFLRLLQALYNQWLNGFPEDLSRPFVEPAPEFEQGLARAGEIARYSNVLLRCDSMPAMNALDRFGKDDTIGLAWRGYFGG